MVLVKSQIWKARAWICRIVIQVLYLDYGNSESLPADQLYDLPSEYSSVQMLSIRCCLYQWPDLQGTGTVPYLSLGTYLGTHYNPTVGVINRTGR